MKPLRKKARSCPSTMFSATEMCSGQRLYLKHHADAGPCRIKGAKELEAFAVASKLARGWLLDPGEDTHERRLPGAVLPDKPDDLVGADVDANVLKRVGDAEGFRKADGLEPCARHFTMPMRRRSSPTAIATIIISPWIVVCR